MTAQHDQAIKKRQKIAQLAAAIVGCDQDKVVEVKADVIGMTVTYSTDCGHNTSHINWGRLAKVGGKQ